MRDVVVDHQRVGVPQGLVLTEIDPLGLVVALPVESARLHEAAEAFLIAGDAALLRHLERGLHEDPVVEPLPDLGAQQEAPVEDRDAAGGGDGRLGVDRRVGRQIERLRDVGSRSTRPQGAQDAGDQDVVVVRVPVVSFGRLPPLPVADRAWVVEPVDRQAKARAAHRAQALSQGHSQGRLSARGDTGDRDPQDAIGRLLRAVGDDPCQPADELGRGPGHGDSGEG